MNMVKAPGFTEISSSANRKIVWFYVKNINNVQNYPDFLRSIEPELNQILKTRVQQGAIKFNLKLEATYSQPNVENSAENRAFKTSAREIFMYTDIDSIVEQAFVKLLAEEDAYVSRGSGFTLESIDGLLLGIYNYTPMTGSSYIELPACIDRKRATINPQNNDQQCFKWAILARHVAENLSEKYKYCVGENYTHHEGKYNFDGISFPTPLSDISKFEKNNPNVTVNVYGLDKKLQPPRKYPTYEVYPLRVADEEKANHFDLLLVTDDESGSHYIYISNFSRLIRSQKTGHKEKVVFCKRCFTSFDDRRHKYKLSGQEALTQHKLICGAHKLILPMMPEEGTVLEFNAWQNAQRHPIVIYADFEALLVKTDEMKGKNTTIIQKHRPMSYGLIVKASEDVPTELLSEHNIPTKPVIYRGSESQPDVARHFVDTVTDISLKIEKLLKTNMPLNMSADDIQAHEAATHCNLCKCDVNNYTRIRDHDHLTGKFRQTLCNICNLSLKQPKYVPVFIHNLSNYDAHFIVTELGYDTHRIKVIPNNEEKFVTFSKYISNDFTIRFVDTFRFMATSLSTLAANLITPNFEKFRITAKHFSNNDLPLVTRKGVYPYDFTDDWAKLEQTTLPAKEDFYSTLTEEHIKETEYQFAEDVWSHFNCQTLGEYSDLYLKIDVLLLADVFENFRDLCLNTYNLDPSYYFTAPAFSFDAMLKYTAIKLDLLTDYEMLLMIENGIRGGLTQASMRYAKPNNERTPDYNPADLKSWLVYQDCNNLYGWAMSQFMPYGGFKWVKPSLNGLADLNATSPIGRFYEVDITYPKELHDKHNSLPFLPQNSIPSGSKVHRVVQFNQSDWLAKYIALNTEMRKKAKNEFEKDFFKLLNNAVFGKTMENVRKRMEMELVSCDRRLQKLINKSTFKHCTTYSENLNAVTLENKIINFCKPIYIGLAVLDISKSLMYDYHYNVMQKHYGDKIELMYTDTDSLVYYIQTDDFYKDLKNNNNLLNRMDTSNLPEDHPCYIAERKKIPGLFSDETDGLIMTEFCALRAKSYAYILDGREKIKAKGIRRHVVKNHMTFNDHKKCLFGEDEMDVKRENVTIRSFKHQLMTIKSNKLTFNNYDDKRIVLEDKIHTLAHGHYSLEEDELESE
ncbi:hypothetical protein AGLY_003942 [Aphis glycines]|uniref:DNA-directed DNA polymerase n=1 Tax=Aphis glycines TaxID=307491 RepID=A0A6G0TZ36_APHGL|nr:hypothetical protein AGLY_003942 [Aphis glycines]